MAAAKEMLQEVQRKITCSIHRSDFSEVVIIKCGHRFCKACLFSMEGGEATVLSCPECMQVSQVRECPRDHGNLAQLTEQGKELYLKLLQRTQTQSQCDRHKEAFQWFCQNDQIPLCVTCSLSPEHGAHILSPIEEAAENFRKMLQHMWRDWEKCFEESEKILAQQKPDIDLQWMITEEFNRLHLFLTDEKSKCFERINQEQRANQDRISHRIQTVQNLIVQLEEEDAKYNLDLLQGAQQWLERGESVLSHGSNTVLPQMREYPISALIEMLSQFRVDITLRPAATNSYVTVSEDGKSVKAGEAWHVETENLVLDFDFKYYGALAEQAFSSGRQYWEVDVTQVAQWMLGVCAPSMGKKRKRKEDSCQNLFLLIRVKKKEDYYLETHPGPLNHLINSPLPRVGVYLECFSGTLAFYNILQRCLIYRYQGLPFTAPVKPIFLPVPPLPGTKAGSMTLCPGESPLCI